MDSSMYNEYLRNAREHGRHAYDNGEPMHDEYSDVYLQRAFESGFKEQHELESELI